MPPGVRIGPVKSRVSTVVLPPAGNTRHVRNLDVFCGEGKHGEQDCLIYHCGKNKTKLVVLIPKGWCSINSSVNELGNRCAAEFDLFRLNANGGFDGPSIVNRIWLCIKDGKLSTESDVIDSTATEEEWEKVDLVVCEPSETVYSDDPFMKRFCAGLDSVPLQIIVRIRQPPNGPPLEQLGIASEIKLECKNGDIASDVAEKIAVSQKIPRLCVSLSYRNTIWTAKRLMDLPGMKDGGTLDCNLRFPEPSFCRETQVDGGLILTVEEISGFSNSPVMYTCSISCDVAENYESINQAAKDAGDRVLQQMRETAGCSRRVTISKEDLQILKAGGILMCCLSVVHENSLGLKAQGVYSINIDEELLGPGKRTCAGCTLS